MHTPLHSQPPCHLLQGPVRPGPDTRPCGSCPGSRPPSSSFLLALQPGLSAEVPQGWEDSHYRPGEGCFFQTDTADGGEDSISGDGCRVSINAAMVGSCSVCTTTWHV